MKTVSSPRFLAWGLGYWAIFMVAATLDGIVRMGLLIPALGDFWGHIVSGLFMLAVIYAGTWILLRRIGRPTRGAALWGLGILWGGLTVGFELFIVTVARGEPAAVLWADYHPANILSGNFILIGIVLMVLAPWLMARLTRG
jgi:hypothetical protein